MTRQCALIDTCVLLSDPNVIVRAARLGFPLLTNIVLEEIDYNKKNKEASVAGSAKSIFRKIKHQTPSTLSRLPCGKAVHPGDTIYRYDFDGAPLYVLTRATYRNDASNDAKIREIAKDYDLILVTEDGGNKTLADVEGVRAVVWRRQASSNRPSPHRVAPTQP